MREAYIDIKKILKKTEKITLSRCRLSTGGGGGLYCPKGVYKYHWGALRSPSLSMRKKGKHRLPVTKPNFV